MKTEKLSILFPWQEEVIYQPLPENTWHDLGFDVLVEKVAKKPQEVEMIRQVMTSLTPEPRVCAFRAEVFEDILRHPEIREQLMKLLEKVKMFYDYGVVARHSSDEAGVWDLMHRLEEYHEYILSVEAIRECLSDRELRSEGLLTLRETVETIYRDNGFAALKKDVEEMRTAASEVKSLTVGVNLNDRFEAVSMGLITVNRKPFTRSNLLKNFVSAVSLRDDVYGEADWNGSYGWHPASGELGIGTAMDRLASTATVLHNPLLALSVASIPASENTASVPRQFDSAATLMVSRLVRKLKDTLGRYIHVSVREISNLIPELVFYTRWAEYLEPLIRKGWHFCRPGVFEAADTPARLDARGFYNLKLIGSEAPESVVPNDLVFDETRRIYVLTGANRGGKTTVTQALGQALLLAQSGIRVPGDSFRFDPADRILTHFPADEDKTMDLGRLGEECRRFRELYAAGTGKSLLLLNETFSTTSFEEGYEIAVDALRAILDRDIRTVYNTHMHKLARDLDDVVNTPGRTGRAWSLVSETRDGKATFHIRIAPPEGKSFAREIAEKYGVTYDLLTQL